MEQRIVPMGKRKFRIGDLADELKVKKYVIRFWEKEFDLASDRSEGGQRFYTEDDLQFFMKIKDLLYQQGFTIAGARKQLGVDQANSITSSSLMAVSSLSIEDVIVGLPDNQEEIISGQICPVQLISQQDLEAEKESIAAEKEIVAARTAVIEQEREAFYRKLLSFKEELLAIKARL